LERVVPMVRSSVSVLKVEGIVERARGGVQALHELAQHEVLVVDDEDAARGLAHRPALSGGRL